MLWQGHKTREMYLYNAVAEVLVTIPMKQEHHVLPPLCHSEDDVADGPCIPSSVIMLCSDELEMQVFIECMIRAKHQAGQRL
jgi:hypothetical protein